MNSKSSFSPSNPVDYTFRPHGPTEETRLYSFSNTKPPMSNSGVDTGIANISNTKNTKLPMSNSGVDTGVASISNTKNTKLPMSNPGVDTGVASISNTKNIKLPMSNPGVDPSIANTSAVGGSAVVRPSGSKPRGRPRGAKNKSHRNVINTAPQITSVVLEIHPGVDMVAWLKQFAQARNASVNVLNGSGMVSQVAYSHVASPHPIMLSETLNLVSLAGLVTPSGICLGSFAATLSRLNGSVFGVRALSLVAMESVVLTVLVSQNTEVITAPSPNHGN
ncbi:hypothetical protein DCAR_0626477 [Daucus carota subsp. sativus]|uniref:Uncharacterized protein n=1 Tax=Daucus carota subsp. sativus TaxID=79200 RepID=A0A164X377_DAUCS|nr:PREDICTED: AT-hook motif nuclear-localized protein 29-like [Daucus carota subsp. sativus]WOH07048.1 hypothetical protein DCAR_0626477 [Daucus carota subsp. sativus]